MMQNDIKDDNTTTEMNSTNNCTHDPLQHDAKPVNCNNNQPPITTTTTTPTTSTTLKPSTTTNTNTLDLDEDWNPILVPTTHEDEEDLTIEEEYDAADVAAMMVRIIKNKQRSEGQTLEDGSKQDVEDHEDMLEKGTEDKMSVSKMVDAEDEAVDAILKMRNGNGLDGNTDTTIAVGNTGNDNGMEVDDTRQYVVDDRLNQMRNQSVSLASISSSSVSLESGNSSSSNGSSKDNGKLLCKHGKFRVQCVYCYDEGIGGGSICEHRKRKTQCLSCHDLGKGGGSICEHRRRKDGCSQCKQNRKQLQQQHQQEAGAINVDTNMTATRKSSANSAPAVISAADANTSTSQSQSQQVIPLPPEAAVAKGRPRGRKPKSASIPASTTSGIRVEASSSPVLGQPTSNNVIKKTNSVQVSVAASKSSPSPSPVSAGGLIEPTITITNAGDGSSTSATTTKVRPHVAPMAAPDIHHQLPTPVTPCPPKDDTNAISNPFSISSMLSGTKKSKTPDGGSSSTGGDEERGGFKRVKLENGSTGSCGENEAGVAGGGGSGLYLAEPQRVYQPQVYLPVQQQQQLQQQYVPFVADGGIQGQQIVMANNGQYGIAGGQQQQIQQQPQVVYVPAFSGDVGRMLLPSLSSTFNVLRLQPQSSAASLPASDHSIPSANQHQNVTSSLSPTTPMVLSHPSHAALQRQQQQQQQNTYSPQQQHQQQQSTNAPVQYMMPAAMFSNSQIVPQNQHTILSSSGQPNSQVILVSAPQVPSSGGQPVSMMGPIMNMGPGQSPHGFVQIVQHPMMPGQQFFVPPQQQHHQQMGQQSQQQQQPIQQGGQFVSGPPPQFLQQQQGSSQQFLIPINQQQAPQQQLQSPIKQQQPMGFPVQPQQQQQQSQQSSNVPQQQQFQPVGTVMYRPVVPSSLPLSSTTMTPTINTSASAPVYQQTGTPQQHNAPPSPYIQQQQQQQQQVQQFTQQIVTLPNGQQMVVAGSPPQFQMPMGMGMGMGMPMMMMPVQMPMGMSQVGGANVAMGQNEQGGNNNNNIGSNTTGTTSPPPAPAVQVPPSGKIVAPTGDRVEKGSDGGGNGEGEGKGGDDGKEKTGTEAQAAPSAEAAAVIAAATTVVSMKRGRRSAR
ncbi:hypothetical protein HDU76_003787 [Blyttiomyces sp. JEL0837]|nr:hypothetical protein HDU76_003787 [Blyttiomyces sp. JEL0837]